MPTLNLRSVLFSGKIISIYEPNQDKLGKQKFSFTLELKSNEKSHNIRFMLPVMILKY